MALEPRYLETRDVDSGQPCYVISVDLLPNPPARGIVHLWVADNFRTLGAVVVVVVCALIRRLRNRNRPTNNVHPIQP